MSSFVRGAAWVTAMVLAVGFLLQLFVVEPWQLPEADERLSASVEPNLRAGDRVLVARQAAAHPGQLVRCVIPGKRSGFVVGRAFGRAGDVVDVRGENSFINEKVVRAQGSCLPRLVTEPSSGRGVEVSCAVFGEGSRAYAVLSRRTRSVSEPSAPVRIEEGTLYLASDNRLLHDDSRDFGLVDAANCQPIVFRLWGASLADEARRFDLL